MCAVHKGRLSLKRIQTLPHTDALTCLDMRSSKDSTAVILITGLENGDVRVYKSPLSHTQRLHFTLQHRFHPHSGYVYDVNLHPHKALFISASEDADLKVWNIKDVTAPRLIKRIPHPAAVYCCKYSRSSLIATGCADRVLRVYDKEPLLSLCWSFDTSCSGYIQCVAWSPSNYIAASFALVNSCDVQVWDSAFQTVFKLRQEGASCSRNGLVFASNDLLMSPFNLIYDQTLTYCSFTYEEPLRSEPIIILL